MKPQYDFKDTLRLMHYHLWNCAIQLYISLSADIVEYGTLDSDFDIKYKRIESAAVCV